MLKYLAPVAESALVALAMLILFATVFVIAAGCWLVTMAVTDFAQIMQTPIPY